MRLRKLENIQYTDNTLLAIKRLKTDIETRYRILYEYTRGPLAYKIAQKIDDDSYLYLIEEPQISREVEALISRVITKRSMGLMENADLFDTLYQEAEENGFLEALEREGGAAKYYMKRVLSGYGPLYPILMDNNVEEIAVEGPGIPVAVFHRLVSEGWLDSNIVFEERELDSLVLSLARKTKKYVSIAHPLGEGLTPEGHRIAITFSREVSRRGSSIIVRKFPSNPLTLLDLVKMNTLSPLMASYLWLLIENKAFIMILGPMASGISVAAEEHVFIKNNDRMEIVSFKELWRLSSGKEKTLKKTDLEILQPQDNIRILSLKNGRIKWMKPLSIIRHYFKGRIYRVTTRKGYSINVTGDHSLLKIAETPYGVMLKPVKAGNVKPGTPIPVLKELTGLRNPHQHSVKVEEAVTYDSVEKIKIIEYEGYVYDIEVPGSLNFEANGILVHNTTMLQALTSLIPFDQRVVTIEDTPELNLPHTHWDPLITRYAYTPGSEHLSISLLDLAKFALRRRAEYMLIGEVRGEEARVLAQAAATGQGSLCSFHADSAYSAIVRLKSHPINLGDAFLSLIWAMIIMRRVKARKTGVARRVFEIDELKGDENKLVKIFQWSPTTDEHLPLDPEDLIESSHRLKIVADLNGWSKERLLEEIEARTSFIEELASGPSLTNEDLAKAIASYYKRVYRT